MSIRFRCQRCHQLLGIGPRKADSQIQCPKCGAKQTVPNDEAAAAALAMDRLAKTHDEVESTADVVVFEGDPPAAASPPAPQPGQAAPMPPTPGLPLSRVPGEPVPPGMILFPRRTIYVQAALFVMLAATAFTAGYLIGRGDADYGVQVREEEAARQRVEITGRLVYEPSPDTITGDENAIVLALPLGRLPEQKLSIRDIRPHSPPPGENHPSLLKIRGLGGAYARADARGDFRMTLPKPGDYRLLIVSRHARRPAGNDVEVSDLVEIRDYFELAELLIDRCKYRWTLEKVGGGSHRVEANFGRDGRP